MMMRSCSVIASLCSMVILLSVLTVALKFKLKRRQYLLILSVLVVAKVVIIAFIVVKCREECRRRRRNLENSSPEPGSISFGYSYLHKTAGTPRKFSYREIQAATADFGSLVGQGGSATVYKGILEDATEVAVKVLGADYGLKEFRSEVAAIGAVQHRNLVRLIGFCVHGSYKILVYEFVPNGSLESWIFRPRNSVRANNHISSSNCNNSSSDSRVLGWSQRFSVAINVAKALAYLHHDCRSKILHLDVKPENVLIDNSFEAKLTDFGLSKLMCVDESRIVTTIRGTKGYLAPEWLLENGISEKCDVYSFGMLMLEIVGGRRNVGNSTDNNNNGGPGSSGIRCGYFPKIVREKVRQGKLMELVDERISRESVDGEQLRRMVMVSLWCIQARSRMRPTMKSVVDMLEGICEVKEPPESQMLVLDVLRLDLEEQQQQQHQRQPNLQVINVDSPAPTSAAVLPPAAAAPSLGLSCNYSMSAVYPR